MCVLDFHSILRNALRKRAYRSPQDLPQPTGALEMDIAFGGTTSLGEISIPIGGSLGRAMRLTRRVTAQRPIWSVPRSIVAGRGLSIARPDCSLLQEMICTSVPGRMP